MTFAPQMNTPDLVDILGAGINDIADGFIERHKRKQGESGKEALARQMFPDASPEDLKRIAKLPDEQFKMAGTARAGIGKQISAADFDAKKQEYLDFGIPEEEADAYAEAYKNTKTVQERSLITKGVQRRIQELNAAKPADTNFDETGGNIDYIEAVGALPAIGREKLQSFDWPDVPTYSNESEVSQRERKKDYRNSNTKTWTEVQDRIDRQQRKADRIERQMDLVDDLSSQATRMVAFDADGGIKPIWGLGANKADQEMVKFISEWMEGVKDDVGARVTNIDLLSYMRKFPGIWNSKEAIRDLFEYIDLNEKKKALLDIGLDHVYQKYGTESISAPKARSIANKLVADDMKALNEKDKMLEQRMGEHADKAQGTTVNKMRSEVNKSRPEEKMAEMAGKQTSQKRPVTREEQKRALGLG